MPLHRTSASDALACAMRGPNASSLSSKSNQPIANSSPSNSPNSNAGSALPPPHPSASILQISPSNRILLLHRVTTSSTFASAHVFPGGHVDPAQDGALPPISSPDCHKDSLPYRLAAIRECFEESGLLLAHCRKPHHEQQRPRRQKDEQEEEKEEEEEAEGLIQLSDQDRDSGRTAIHSGAASFQTWVAAHGGVIDVDGLIPFTRWLTPANVPKRFSMQMYLYFLPLDNDNNNNNNNNDSDNDSDDKTKSKKPIPTADGGIEHTAASFLYPGEWIQLALQGAIVLYPPQFFLLSLLAEFLCAAPPPSPSGNNPDTTAILAAQRARLMEFVKDDKTKPPWGEKCISPNPITIEKGTGVMIMGLGDPGPELEGTGRKGDEERVIAVDLDGGMLERGRPRPRLQEVLWRKDWERQGRKGRL